MEFEYGWLNYLGACAIVYTYSSLLVRSIIWLPFWFDSFNFSKNVG